jgi:predicted DNA binding CopG/RHH family protein
MFRPTRSKLRKDAVIGVRISDDEMNKIKVSAMESGLTLSSWCREIILDYIKMSDECKQNSGRN